MENTRIRWLHSSEEALPIRSEHCQNTKFSDIASGHYLLTVTFQLRLKRTSKPKHTRLTFDFEKLRDPNVVKTFQPVICVKFAPLTIMNNEEADMDAMIIT